MRDWKKEIYEVHPNLVPMEEIKSGSIKFRAKCSIDGYEWEYRCYDLLRGFGCHQCKGVPRYTTDTFKQKIKNLHPTIKIIGEYKSSHTKIEFECLVCGENGFKKPNQFLNGAGCRNCGYKKISEKLRKSEEKFKGEFYAMVSDEYTVLGEYKTTETDIKIKHNICGEIFESRPHNLLNKAKPSRCPKCNGGVRKKDSEYHNKEVKELTNGEYELVSNYQDVRNINTYIHNVCKKEFKTSAGSFLHQGVRCQHCFVISKGEVAVSDTLRKLNVSFSEQKTFEGLKDKKKLRFDFYIESLNSIIEYDGRQHFEVVERFGGQNGLENTLKRDAIKNKFCKDNGIKLLRIPYYEKDIEGTIKRFIEEVQK